MGRQPVRHAQRPPGRNVCGVFGGLSKPTWMAGGGLGGLVGIRKMELSYQAQGVPLTCLFRPQSPDSWKPEFTREKGSTYLECL